MGHKIFIFFLLAVVYGAHGSQLPTVSKSELLKIIDCISDSKDFQACESFLKCNHLMPEDVFKRFEECQKIVNAPAKCERGKPFFPNSEQPSKIFDCLAEKFPTVEGEDRRKMKDFEECAIELHKKTCKIPKYQ